MINRTFKVTNKAHSFQNRKLVLIFSAIIYDMGDVISQCPIGDARWPVARLDEAK